MDFDFGGKTALVTGGSKGIGRAISMALAARGAYVVVNYASDNAAAEKTVSDIKGAGGEAVAVKADVADARETEALFGMIRKDPGRLDILVNNAGIIRDKLLMFMGPEDWDRVIAVNLTGVYNTARSASRLMIGQKYGKIVNIVSPSAIVGRAGQTNYAAAKGGVIAFTKSLARELARFSIWVNAVSPGIIETEMLESIPEDVKESFLDAVPMGRFGTPDEVTGAVLFLASERSNYITGQVICVDGGLT